MTVPIFQLAYLSTRATGVTDEDVIDCIVLPAMRKNRNLDVTGCLWFSAGHFFQVIEGPHDTIDALFVTIEKDVRHHTVNVLLTENIPDRRFERFGMRAVQSNASQSLPRLIDTFDSKPRKAQPATAVRRRWNPFARPPGLVNSRHDPADSADRIAHAVILELATWSDATPI